MFDLLHSGLSLLLHLLPLTILLLPSSSLFSLNYSFALSAIFTFSTFFPLPVISNVGRISSAPAHPDMEGISIVCMNVNGLNIPNKRRILFYHFRRSKADVILLQETHANKDTEKIWRREWGGNAYFCNGSQSSKGLAILVSRDVQVEVLDRRSDESGRILCMDIRLKDTVFTVGSIYAPTQDKSSEQLENLDNIEAFLEDLTSTNIIVGGDFNCFLNPLLDRNSQLMAPSHTETYRSGIFSFAENWSLCDVWRQRNPGKTGYTFRRGSYASRLDFVLISNHLSELVSASGSKMLAHSDHAMVRVSIKPSQVRKGPGLWKFDNMLLGSEDFVTQMSDFLSEWTPPVELQVPNAVWEWLKFEIKGFVNTYTYRIYSLEKQRISSLSEELEELYRRADEDAVDLSMEIESVRRELREIEEAKARKIIFKAKCNWALFAERPTKYFLNLEKRKNRENNLNALTTEDGSEVTEITGILKVGKAFYENLYKSQENTLAPMEDVREALK